MRIRNCGNAPLENRVAHALKPGLYDRARHGEIQANISLGVSDEQGVRAASVDYLVEIIHMSSLPDFNEYIIAAHRQRRKRMLKRREKCGIL